MKRTAKPIQRDAIAFLIPALQVGGAEHQLLELANGLIAGGRTAIIITYDESAASLAGQASPNAARILRVPKTANVFRFLRRLRGTLEAEKVGVLHAYLKSAQTYAILLRIMGWKGAVVFGIRDSLPLFHRKDLKNLLCDLIAFNRLIVPNAYVFNSRAGLINKKLRSSRRRTVVIGNSVDARKFTPERRTSRLRTAIRSKRDELIVGIVANVSVYKDYPTFIKAAARVVKDTSNVRFVAIGNHNTPEGRVAGALVDGYQLGDRFVFLGPRSDVSDLLPELDVLCSSSVTEGFSNVIAEAMACGVPCVVTDVGDSAHIVGDTGKVVPPGDPDRLAMAIEEFLHADSAARREYGARARARAVEHFSPEVVIAQHLAVYDSVINLNDDA